MNIDFSLLRAGLIRKCLVRRGLAAFAGAAALAASPLAAQSIETFDPDTAIDGDLAEQPGSEPVYTDQQADVPVQQSVPADSVPAQTGSVDSWSMDTETVLAPEWADPVVTSGDPATAAAQASGNPSVAAAQGDTYKKDDLIGAAEDVFGKGAEGLAHMIEGWLEEQGEPNGYIVGREGGGAFFVGARYGSGTLYHKIEGQKPVYWTGPSIGFDIGANAANTFMLVYNLYDTEELYERFPAGEGQAYIVGGMNASYMRKGDVVLIPIRMGAGLRLGVNAGYMKFSKQQRWLPF